MTPPDVDQELDRLFTATRSATLPDPGARDRVRGAVTARLASPALGSAAARRAWLPWVVVGLVGLGLGGIAAFGVKPSGQVASQTAPRVDLPPPVLSTTPEAKLSSGTAAANAEPAASAPRADVPPRVASKPTAPPTVASLTVAPPTVAPSASSGGEPGDELSLVRDMQATLRAGDSARALGLANEHARRFSSGALVEEREGVRAVARCQLAAAEARAEILAGFLRTFGSSPYAARVKAACR